MIVSLQEPTDGFDKMERLFLRQVIINLYKKLTNPDDRFIVMAYFESCYTEEEIGHILDVTQVRIHQRIKKIRELLKSLRQANQV